MSYRKYFDRRKEQYIAYSLIIVTSVSPAYISTLGEPKEHFLRYNKKKKKKKENL
jgi:hypothetical protein